MATAGPVADEGEQRPTFIRNIQFDGRPVGELNIQIDPQDIVRRVSESRNSLLLRELILIVLVAIGEFTALSYFIARPVSVISDSLAESIDEKGRIRKKIPIHSNDEFGQLSSQFNMMREQLNLAHKQLHSRIEAADARLIETNQALLQQSEELKQMNRRLMDLSITDDLTGLYNRRHFEEVMSQELAHSRRKKLPCSLMIMDIDFFKKINDTYGHAVGDQVLRSFSQIIRDTIRQNDIPCRIGGEEFVVACRQTSESEAVRLAERLREAAELTPFHLDDLTIPFAVSVGVATSKSDEDTVDSMFLHADRALYHSKQHGRNRVTHHTALEEKTQQA